MSSIITFYSFKGGVGRSMALANIAYILASEMGRHVLTVDWDLEAPGLEMYFRNCPGASIQISNRGGLIDLLTEAHSGAEPDWRDYVSFVTFGGQRLDLITSGRRDEDYPAKVLAFDWVAFFEKAEGGAFIESLRDSWHRAFDITLIDSRTGFTDAGGVCNVQLPDVLVPVFTTTEESAQGVLDVVERSQRARQKLAYDRSRLLVFPLLSRYDGRTQYVEAKTWLNRFAEWFGPQYADWLPTTITPLQAIEGTKLPYVGYFSFGTQMPAALDDRSDRESLGYAYYVAATIIANDFQQVERLIADPGVQDLPTRRELALLRMHRLLQEEKSEWRSVDTLASAAGIGVTEALDLLRGELSVDFSRGQSGEITARLRDGSANPAREFLTERQVARARFDKINSLKEKECAGYLESAFFPARFDRSRFRIEELNLAIKRGAVDYTGWPFIYFHPTDTYVIEDGIETLVHTKDFGGDDLLDFWQLHQSGLLYHRTTMRPNMARLRDSRKVCVMDFRAAAIHFALAIDSATRLFDGLISTDEELSFVLTLLGTENRMLVSSGQFFMPLAQAYVCRIPEITVDRRHSIADWRVDLIEHAVEIANEVYLRFNWLSPNLGAARTAVQKTFAGKL